MRGHRCFSALYLCARPHSWNMGLAVGLGIGFIRAEERQQGSLVSQGLVPSPSCSTAWPPWCFWTALWSISWAVTEFAWLLPRLPWYTCWGRLCWASSCHPWALPSRVLVCAKCCLPSSHRWRSCSTEHSAGRRARAPFRSWGQGPQWPDPSDPKGRCHCLVLQPQGEAQDTPSALPSLAS